MSCSHYWLFHQFNGIDVMVLRCQNCNKKLVTTVSPLAVFLYLLKPYMSGAHFFPSELRYVKMFANVKVMVLRLTEEQLNEMIRTHRRGLRKLVRWRRSCRIAMVVL
jgi:hypothetical protein